jgi:peptide/nickel transport system ATP-binding protein
MASDSLLSLSRAVAGEQTREALLSVRLDLDYPGKRRALEAVEFDIRSGEVLGLVGESGSGKSSIGMAILRLLRHKGAEVRGAVQLDGRDLLRLPEREMRHVRGREIGLVLQSPLASLNPALRLGTQFQEAWNAHRNTSRDEARREILRVLDMVSLPAEDAFLRKYPRQLSVGLAQRVLIGMAILHRPKLLIADEPTSALDVITQSEILKLFAALNRELNMAILYISHDLLSVAALCHRVAILRGGRIVERAVTERIFRNPVSAYARALVEALPVNPFGAEVAQDSCPAVDRTGARSLLGQ